VGPRVEPILLVKQAKMQGFLVSQFFPQFQQAREEMISWFKQGKIRDHVTIREGIENTPKAWLGLMQGDNIGKMIVKVAGL